MFRYKDVGYAARNEASRVPTFANVIDYCAMRDASLRAA
jgi:hypothetical protein